MAIKFNPLTGNFDFTGSGGGGGGPAFFAGEVATYADLPLDGTAALNSRWLVRTNSGTWPFSSYKQSGIYIRTATVGSSRDNDYKLTDTSFHDVMSDDAFLIFDNTDPTRAAKFDVGAQVGANQTRVITVPNKNITLDDAGDSRDPNLHAASHLPDGADEIFDQDLNTTDAPSFESLTVDNQLNCSGAIDFSGAGSLLLPAITTSLAISEVGDGITGTFRAEADSLTANRTYDLPNASGTLALQGAITTSGLTQATARILGRTTASTGAIEEIQIGSGLSLSSGELSATGGAGVTSVTGTAPIVSSGGTTPAISISAATTSAAGSMSSADKTKLDGIASGAEVNVNADWNASSGDAQILNKPTLGTAAAAATTDFAAASHTHAASAITSGTLDVARIPTGATSTTVALGNHSHELTSLAATGATNGHVLTANGSGGVTFAAASGGIGGATGSTDNAILRADGTGGSTAQNSAFVIADNATASPNNTVNHASIQATGGTTDVSVSIVPKGAGAFTLQVPDNAATGGNARGTNAIDLCTNRSAASQVASGANSFIGGGRINTASGLDSAVCGGNSNVANAYLAGVFCGNNNTASGQGAFVGGGGSNTASGSGAAIVAGSSATASGSNSLAIGLSATADRSGMIAFGGAGGGLGAQQISFVLRNKVSTATAVELLGDGPGGSVRLTVPSGRTLACIINIMAATSGGEFANRYIRAATIANRGGTTALRGAVKDIDTDEQIGGADVTISANDTNDAIRVEFSGVAPVTGCTAAASTDVVSKTAHGFSNNDDIIFSSLTGGAGLTATTTTYWVIDATADTFKVSTTRGGGAVNITTDYTDMTATRLFRVVASIDAVEISHGT